MIIIIIIIEHNRELESKLNVNQQKVNDIQTRMLETNTILQMELPSGQIL